MFTNHPQLAKEFARKTANIASLPEHVKKKKGERPAKPKTQ